MASIATPEGSVTMSAVQDSTSLRQGKEDLPTANPVPSFPEGGWQAWLTVLGGSMVVFCTFGNVQSFGVYQEYYTLYRLNELTPSDISWIGSTQVFLLFGGGLVSGRLFDEGYFHPLIIFGSVLYLFSVFMLSITQPHHYYQTFLAQGIGMGLASGILFLPFLSVTSHYFRRRRTVAMGIVLAGSSLGAVIYPIMLNNLFNSVGYAWAVRASGFLDMGFLILANLMMKTRLPNRRQMPNRKPVDVKGILTDVGYWLSVIGAGCVFWGLFVPFFYLQLFAELHGLSSTLSFYSIPILNASSMFGRTIPNLLADIWGPFNIIIPCVIIAGGLVFLMFVTSSVGGMIAFGILYGFFSGAFMSLMSPVAASFCRDLNEIGFRIGLASFAVAFTLLTGTPIAGALVQENGTYVWYRPLVFATVTVLAGAAFLVVSRHMLSKRRGSQIV